jgi:hypothetical protein
MLNAMAVDFRQVCFAEALGNITTRHLWLGFEQPSTASSCWARSASGGEPTKPGLGKLDYGGGVKANLKQILITNVST